MTFDELFPDAEANQPYKHLNSNVVRFPIHNAECVVCKGQTQWFDSSFEAPVCGPECHKQAWHQYHEVSTRSTMQNYVSANRDRILEELTCGGECDNRSKDIIVVIHDQLEYVKVCLESVLKRTQNFTLYLWDNGSAKETEDYLAQVAAENPGTVVLMRSEDNLGFLEPNNRLAEIGTGDYIVLLNSDTQVFDGWDTSMLGYLQANTNTAQIGYLGGTLLEDGRGTGGRFGGDIDYVTGFCSCFSRDTYREFGLFDGECYRFAYFEDSDFSLRLKAAGKSIYALHLMLVHHYQNKTVIAVEKEGKIDLKASFNANQKAFQARWANYLANERVLLKEDTPSV